MHPVPRVRGAAIAAYGRAGAGAIAAGLETLRTTCHVEIEAPSSLPAGGRVYVAWHGHALYYFVTMLGRPPAHVALCHPSWVLRPWMDLATHYGCHAVPGSTGHGGREASHEIVTALREGLCTVVFPDGPAGPPGRARPGALHMAAQAGVPLVPVRFEVDRAVRLPRWDGLRLPLPGARIEARMLAPLFPNATSIEADRARLEAALGPPPS